MKLCAYCSAENPEDQTYCGKCGAVLKKPLNCGDCGAPCPQGAQFCHKCGRQLQGGRAAPVGTTGTTASAPWPNLLGSAGAALALLGVFTAFVRVPLVGGINYLSYTSLGKLPLLGFGAVVACVLGAVGLWVGVNFGAVLAGLAIAGLAGYGMYNAISAIQRAEDGLTKLVQIGPGGVIMFVGAAMLVAAGPWATKASKARKRR